MLKLLRPHFKPGNVGQPPSGGCVLKQRAQFGFSGINQPAAFRRLCVETFGSVTSSAKVRVQPPSGGCVLKRLTKNMPVRLQVPAAFRRLCVETQILLYYWIFLYSQPPSGGCVLKHKPSHDARWRISQPPSGGCVLKRPKGNTHTRN